MSSMSPWLSNSLCLLRNSATVVSHVMGGFLWTMPSESSQGPKAGLWATGKRIRQGMTSLRRRYESVPTSQLLQDFVQEAPRNLG